MKTDESRPTPQQGGPQNTNDDTDSTGAITKNATASVDVDRFGMCAYPERPTWYRGRERHADRQALRSPHLPAWAKCVICYAPARNGSIVHTRTCVEVAR